MQRPESQILHISPHAHSRMAQRAISDADVQFVVAHGVSVPDAAPAGAAPRSRVSAVRGGRMLTVVVAHERHRRVVITVF